MGTSAVQAKPKICTALDAVDALTPYAQKEATVEASRQQDQATVPVDVAEHLDKLKVTQLRDLCRGRDISMSGTKNEIIDRLRRHAEGKVPTKTEELRCIQICNQLNRTIRMKEDLKLYDAMQQYAEEGLSKQQCKKRARRDAGKR